MALSEPSKADPHLLPGGLYFSSAECFWFPVLAIYILTNTQCGQFIRNTHNHFSLYICCSCFWCSCSTTTASSQLAPCSASPCDVIGGDTLGEWEARSNASGAEQRLTKAVRRIDGWARTLLHHRRWSREEEKVIVTNNSRRRGKGDVFRWQDSLLLLMATFCRAELFLANASFCCCQRDTQVNLGATKERETACVHEQHSCSKNLSHRRLWHFFL